MEGIQLSLFGKTYREHSAPTKARISGKSSSSSPERQDVIPLYLDLCVGGEPLGSSWETDGVLPGEYLTLNFGESPSVAAESTLSQILEEDVPQKYYLSAKACEGILRRAKRRGKALPPILDAALRAQIDMPQVLTDGEAYPEA